MKKSKKYRIDSSYGSRANKKTVLGLHRDLRTLSAYHANDSILIPNKHGWDYFKGVEEEWFHEYKVEWSSNLKDGDKVCWVPVKEGVVFSDEELNELINEINSELK